MPNLNVLTSNFVAPIPMYTEILISYRCWRYYSIPCACLLSFGLALF